MSAENVAVVFYCAELYQRSIYLERNLQYFSGHILSTGNIYLLAKRYSKRKSHVPCCEFADVPVRCLCRILHGHGDRDTEFCLYLVCDLSISKRKGTASIKLDFIKGSSSFSHFQRCFSCLSFKNFSKIRWGTKMQQFADGFHGKICGGQKFCCTLG